jgi:hypothetical protein
MSEDPPPPPPPLPVRPRFAEIDPADPEPRRVQGWYDCNIGDYELPDPARLVEMTDAQWAARLSTPYLQGGVFVATPAAVLYAVDQRTQLLARTEFLARKAEKAGDHLAGYKLRQGIK